MRTKKQKNKLVIILVIVFILIILGVLVGLYFLTDMFKSEKVLFTKYMVNGFSNINTGYKSWVEAEKYPDKMYEENITAEIDFMENIGTSEENTDNKINDLELELNNKIDNINNYKEYEFALYNYMDSEDGEEVKETLLEGKSINDVSNYLTLENVTDKYLDLGVVTDLLGAETVQIIFSLNTSEDEIMSVITKYIRILNEQLTDDMFSKLSNQNIEVAGSTYRANAYLLSLTKEQYGEIQIKLLEELEKDELILSKIPTEDMKESYKEYLLEEIDNIRAENIGTDITTITVYEASGKTIAMTIKDKEQEQTLKIMQSQRDTNYEYEYLDLTGGININLVVNQTAELKKIEYLGVSEKDNEEVSITYEEDIIAKENGKAYESSIIYETDKKSTHHKVTINIDREIEFVDNIEKEEIEILDIENLDSEENEKIGQALDKIVEKFETSKVVEDFNSMITTIVENGEVFEFSGEGVTEAEKNRFNAQFQLLTVEGADTDKLKEVISLTGQYISALDVVSNTELRVEIDRTNPDLESKTILENFLETADSFEYIISLEYDDETGLVDAINLVIIEDE